jgi:DNA-binding transcriptional regulator WhiA
MIAITMVGATSLKLGTATKQKRKQTSQYIKQADTITAILNTINSNIYY